MSHSNSLKAVNTLQGCTLKSVTDIITHLSQFIYTCTVTSSEMFWSIHNTDRPPYHHLFTRLKEHVIKKTSNISKLFKEWWRRCAIKRAQVTSSQKSETCFQAHWTHWDLWWTMLTNYKSILKCKSILK